MSKSNINQSHSFVMIIQCKCLFGKCYLSTFFFHETEYVIIIKHLSSVHEKGKIESAGNHSLNIFIKLRTFLHPEIGLNYKQFDENTLFSI